MKEMQLFQEVDFCLALLEGRMGSDKTKDCLRREYTDPIPQEWRDALRSQKDLLSEESRLYRMLWYAGMREREEMEHLILTLFYLRYHVSRLP